MKKLLYLFIATAFLISCESNENPLSDDPIVGKWQISSETYNGINESDSCSLQSTVTFTDNAQANAIGFYYDENDNCVSETSSFTWKNLGDSNYEIDYEDGETEIIEITFSNNNSTFSLTTYDTYNNTTNTYTSVYNKI